MAADLVHTPNISQTFVHDLESAFWVLMWLVLSHMQTDWTDTMRSSFLNDIMCPRLYGESGGRNKRFFIESECPIMPDLKIRDNDILYSLLNGLKMTLGVRYRRRPTERLALDPLAIKAKLEGKAPPTEDSLPSSLDDKIKVYDSLMDCLKDHQIILTMFRWALADRSKWPIDDAVIQASPSAARDEDVQMSE
jgi:hypothetical protein